jgi:hypothetical protein
MNVVEFPKPKAKCSRCNDTGERPLGPLVMSGKVIPGSEKCPYCKPARSSPAI